MWQIEGTCLPHIVLPRFQAIALRRSPATKHRKGVFSADSALIRFSAQVAQHRLLDVGCSTSVAPHSLLDVGCLT